MKPYRFYFVSPSVRDSFKRQCQGSFSNDCRAITWALDLHDSDEIQRITIRDEEGLKVVRIYLRN